MAKKVEQVPGYHSWRSARRRCLCSTDKDYGRYGGAGITVCDEWSKFATFIKDMGVRPDGTSLDRIDTFGNYCKENCRWATALEQGNNKRNNVRHEDFENRTLRELLRDLGKEADYVWFKSRLYRGYTLEECLTTPKGESKEPRVRKPKPPAFVKEVPPYHTVVLTGKLMRLMWTHKGRRILQSFLPSIKSRQKTGPKKNPNALSNLASKHRVSIKRLKEGLHQGLSIVDILASSRSFRLTLEGKEVSGGDYARAHGVCPRKFVKGLKQGKTAEGLLEVLPKTNQPERVFPELGSITLRHYAEQNGLSEIELRRLKRRLKRGWSLADSLDTPRCSQPKGSKK